MRLAIIGIIAVALIAAAGAFVLTMHSNSNASATTSVSSGFTQTTAPAQNSTNASKVLFSSTQYAPYSYLVYPGPLSSQSRVALAGFNLTAAQLKNGTANVTIRAIGGQLQYVLIKPDYKLYVIETTFGDDGRNFDSSYGDDGFVLVDPNGYVA